MELEGFGTITPETLQKVSDSDLMRIMMLNPGGVADAWARSELAGRQIVRLREVVQSLKDATHEVYHEVAILSSSSDRLEALTKKVKNLTWALFFLTLLAAIVPIGIEIWKAR
jgi:hypothetical protein